MRLTAWFAVVRAYGIDGFSYASHTTIAKESEALGIQMSYKRAHSEKQFGLCALGYEGEFYKNVKRKVEETLRKWKKGEKTMEKENGIKGGCSLDQEDESQKITNGVEDIGYVPITSACFKEAQKDSPPTLILSVKDITQEVTAQAQKTTAQIDNGVDDIAELLQKISEKILEITDKVQIEEIQEITTQEHKGKYQSEIDITQAMIEKLQNQVNAFEQSIIKTGLLIKNMENVLDFLDKQLKFQINRGNELESALLALNLAKEAFEKIN